MSGESPSVLSHLETLRADARDEIKRRIEQRDKFSIQLTVSLGAIVAVSFSRRELGGVIIAAPLVSIYFTVLILYSYRIHGVLASYLRHGLEPAIATTAGTDPMLEWEQFYSHNAVPGIRKSFFITSLWVVTVSSIAYLAASGALNTLLVVLAAVVYFVACAVITWNFTQ